MEFIAHRINTINELKEIPRQYGVEVDLRDSGKRLILVHDPFSDGIDFEDYIKNYKHGTLILNIKSERIEYKIIELINQHQVKSYFFLDSSFPMIYSLINVGENNIALRFSEFEAIETILLMQGKAKWVWVDCFSKLPLNPQNYKLLKQANYKICLVSPELQGREQDIIPYKRYLDDNNIKIDAVCAKAHNFPKWF